MVPWTIGETQQYCLVLKKKGLKLFSKGSDGGLSGVCAEIAARAALLEPITSISQGTLHVVAGTDGNGMLSCRNSELCHDRHEQCPLSPSPRTSISHGATPHVVLYWYNASGTGRTGSPLLHRWRSGRCRRAAVANGGTACKGCTHGMGCYRALRHPTDAPCRATLVLGLLLNMRLSLWCRCCFVRRICQWCVLSTAHAHLFLAIFGLLGGVVAAGLEEERVGEDGAREAVAEARKGKGTRQ